MLEKRFPKSLVLGCSAGGVIGGGHEIERAPAVSFVGARLPGVQITPFHLDSDEIPERGSDDWRELLPVTAADDPQFLLLADPFTFETDRFVRGLDAEFPASPKVGGLASAGSTPGKNALFLAGDVHASGAVGVALCGDVRVDTLVAQGCRPIGSPMFATRTQRNLIYQLDGKPATGVVEALFESLSDGDRELFRHSLFLGIVMRDGSSEYRQGDFLIRNILGVDPDSGALAIAAVPKENAVVQFHLRDAQTSADDLHTLLARYAQGRGHDAPAGALLFSCLGRGEGLYGEPDHDSNALKEHLSDLTIGGFFCNGEIGPVGDRTFLHGYTSSVALFRRRK